MYFTVTNSLSQIFVLVLFPYFFSLTDIFYGTRLILVVLYEHTASRVHVTLSIVLHFMCKSYLILSESFIAVTSASVRYVNIWKQLLSSPVRLPHLSECNYSPSSETRNGIKTSVNHLQSRLLFKHQQHQTRIRE